MQPVISAIIPIYNTAPWLQRCLDSICGQTLENIEILCVNDGSSDASGAIIEEYARRDARILPITLGRNQGVSVARNIGLGVARGEWLSFVDSDDALEPDFYEKLSAVGRAQDGEIIKGAYRLHRDAPQPPDLTQNARIAADKFSFNTNWVTAIYRTKFIKTHDIHFPAGCSRNEDFVFLYHALLNARKVHVVDEAIYNIYPHPGSLSSGKSRKAIDHIIFARYLLFNLLTTHLHLVGREKYVAEFGRMIYFFYHFPYNVDDGYRTYTAQKSSTCLLEFFKKCHFPHMAVQEIKKYDPFFCRLILNNEAAELAAYLSASRVQRLRKAATANLKKHGPLASASPM